MIARGRGKIVNIASATYWAKHGLQINAIAPGYFKTPLNQALVDSAEFSARTAGGFGSTPPALARCRSGACAPDGGEMQQMTDDERVNWFPHPSPDAICVLYLAYQNGVEGHPRDHDPEGGNIRTLLTLFGGQGSINVPNWHRTASALPSSTTTGRSETARPSAIGRRARPMPT